MQITLWAMTIILALVGTFIPRGFVNPHYFTETPSKQEIDKEKLLAGANGYYLTYGK